MGIFQKTYEAFAYRKERKYAENQRDAAQTRLNNLKANRPAIINPYDDVKDLSGMITNPYAHLSVATGAAEMQAEQADIALANTLDTLRQVGMGAGGATALAQAALQSKKEISASIEQQEVANQQAKAQGEQMKQRLQVEEKARVQDLEAEGKMYEFEADQSRVYRDENREANLHGQYEAYTRQMQMNQVGAVSEAVSGGEDMLGAFLNNN
jgi:hypothetical protein